MDFSIALVLLVGACVCATASVVIQTKERPDLFLSWLFRPMGELLRVTVLRSIAGGVTVLGSVLLIGDLGYWALLLVIPVWAPSLVLQKRHNRRVRSREDDTA